MGHAFGLGTESIFSLKNEAERGESAQAEKAPFGSVSVGGSRESGIVFPSEPLVVRSGGHSGAEQAGARRCLARRSEPLPASTDVAFGSTRRAAPMGTRKVPVGGLRVLIAFC